MRPREKYQGEAGWTLHGAELLLYVGLVLGEAVPHLVFEQTRDGGFQFRSLDIYLQSSGWLLESRVSTYSLGFLSFTFLIWDSMLRMEYFIYLKYSLISSFDSVCVSLT